MSRPSLEDSLLETEKKHVLTDEAEHALGEVVSVLAGRMRLALQHLRPEDKLQLPAERT